MHCWGSGENITRESYSNKKKHNQDTFFAVDMLMKKKARNSNPSLCCWLNAIFRTFLRLLTLMEGCQRCLQTTWRRGRRYCGNRMKWISGLSAWCYQSSTGTLFVQSARYFVTKIWSVIPNTQNRASSLKFVIPEFRAHRSGRSS